MTITIKLNGQEAQVASPSSVVDLIQLKSIPVKFCAVELNGDVVPRAEFETTFLKEGDAVELVTLVGGG